MIAFFVLVISVVCLTIWHVWRHFTVFRRLGIAGPPPSFIAGNLVEIVQKGQLQAMINWGKTYGKVFGYFEGWTPVIAISDPDILKQILVKDFNNFRSRKPFPLAPRKALGLFLENGNQWKRSRTTLTPAFSTGKLRHMFSTINSSIDHLVDNTEKMCQEGEAKDVYSMYQCLTLDIIGRCAFGLQTNAQTDTEDPFLQNIRLLFNGLSKSLIQPLVMLMPFVQHFIFFLKNIVFLFGMNPVVWLRNQMREVLYIRRQMGPSVEVADLVHLMAFSSSNDSHGYGNMSEREIVAQSLTFLLAGYETTSAVLAFLTHILAKHEDVQTRLCEEIDRQLGGKPVTYDNVMRLPYFDMVINEVCRVYPTASLIVTRQAAESCEYKNVRIPAGMAVQANVWFLHHDQDYWNKPETFIPERFSHENKEDIHPYSFMPFGAGPRSCIGQRFALLEIKVAIARILQSYNFKQSSKSQEQLQLVSRGAIVPKNGVHLHIRRRHSI